MLREAKNATVEPAEFSPLGRRWRFVEGDRSPSTRWSTRQVKRLESRQTIEPVPVLHKGARVYWWFEDRFYWEDDSLTAEDVLALVRDRERRTRRRLETAHAALAHTAEAAPRRREPIPRETRLAVFERDGGRCVQCESGFELQFDHVIPVSLGGANTEANLQILCATCNQRKGAAIA